MKSFRKGAPVFPPPPNTWLMTMVGEASGDVGVGVALGVGDAEGLGLGLGVGDGEGLGLGVGVGDGEGFGLGVGVGVGVGVGDGVGAAPPITTDTALLFSSSAVTTSVHLPTPRNSAGTNTCISSSPVNCAGATVSTTLGFPLIVTETLVACTTPVAKIESRRSPFEGSNGPAINVLESRTIASPRPSPAIVNTPGAALEMIASAFDDNPSRLVTRNSRRPVR